SQSEAAALGHVIALLLVAAPIVHPVLTADQCHEIAVAPASDRVLLHDGVLRQGRGGGKKNEQKCANGAHIPNLICSGSQPQVQGGKTLSRANRSNACRADRRPKASKPKDLL